MKRYDEFDSVEELYEAYNITPLSQFLIEKKADINAIDICGDNALFFAIKFFPQVFCAFYTMIKVRQFLQLPDF